MTSTPFHHTLLIMAAGESDQSALARIFQVLDGFQIELLDQSQLIIRDRLVEAILFKIDPAHRSAIESELNALNQSDQLDLALDFAEVEQDIITTRTLAPGAAYVLRIVSQKLSPAILAAIFQEIKEAGGHIHNVRRLSLSPLVCFEYQLILPEPNFVSLRTELSILGRNGDLDLLIVPRAQASLPMAVLLDMDSTFIQQEVIDELAAKVNKRAEVSALTEAAMRGELDFRAALQERCALLAGAPEGIFSEVRENLTLSIGAESLVNTLHKYGHKIGVVSGGFTNVGESLAKDMNLDFFEANQLEVVDGSITGKTIGKIVDREYKAAALRRFADSVGASLSVAVGDGANDLAMIASADIGVAYCAKPATKAAAAFNINQPDLRRLLLLLGFNQEDFVLETTS